MATAITDAHKSALSRAKIALMSRRDSAFFCTLCFSMKFAWDDSVPTAATDGRTIFINPDAYLALTPGQRVSRLLHETLHPALMHLDRKGGRDHERWNVACDYAINGMLIDRGFERISTWLYDPQFQGMSADKIYDLLPEGTPMPPEQADLREPSAEDMPKLKRHIEDILVRAKMQSQISKDKPGTIPGEIEVFIDRLINPKLPWHVILRRWYRDNFSKTDYSWKKPNRRFFPEHHLPSLWSEGLMDIAAFCDISGSVTDDMFARYIGEVGGTLRICKPSKLLLGQFDTSIQSVEPIRDARDLLKVNFHGRGGTDIHPVLDWLNEHKPQGALIFSDGGFHFRSDAQCSVPIIWVVHDNPQWIAPFGKVVYFEMD